MTDTLPHVNLPAEFRLRLEFYWQSLAVYALTLIVYVVLQAAFNRTVASNRIDIVITDPVVVLLGVFVASSAVALAFNQIAHRSIIVSDAGITFSSRFHERTFSCEEIERITVGRDKRVKVRGMFSVVKIRIVGRRRPLRVRPALYDNEAHLVACILHLRQHNRRMEA